MASSTLPPGQLLDALSASAREIQEAVSGLSPVQLNTRPAPDKWAIRDIVWHLRDTERLIFRHRMEILLREPVTKPWFPDIDHTPWETAHRYGEQDARTGLEEFLKERQLTLELLQELPPSRYALQGQHELLGEVTLAEFTTRCAAHTRVHVEQIRRTLRAVVYHIRNSVPCL